MEIPRLITEPEVAEILQISQRTVRLARSAGNLPYIRIGRLVRYRLEDIEAFLSSVTVELQDNGTQRNKCRAPRAGSSRLKTFTELNKVR